jgi:DNA-binding CsgD family transcriptional regulator
MAFDLRRGREAPRLLLDAARRLEPLDAELAFDTYLEALVAAIQAGRFAVGTDVADVAGAARSVVRGHESTSARALLVLGLAIRLTDGYVAAAPTLTEAVRTFRAEPQKLDRTRLGRHLAANLAAMELWDDEAWLELSSDQASLARATGSLPLLPYALDHLAGIQLQTGDLSEAARLLAEAQGPTLDGRADFALRLAAWRGQDSLATELAAVVTRAALGRGEGIAIPVVGYAEAVLYNGLGQYDRALDGARTAVETDDIVTSSRGLFELAEAASRSGHDALARDAARRLSDHAVASGTPWATGAAARSRALCEQGAAAEELHCQAIDLFSRPRMAWYLARARLSYGEWLRRGNRRVDAREQLQAAHDAFAAMGSDGFGDRARRELRATGATVRNRRDDAGVQLTPQEEQIARLAAAGRTNPEISRELFVSARTVEWHLRKVFAKLGIGSRKELGTALPAGRMPRPRGSGDQGADQGPPRVPAGRIRHQGSLTPESRRTT